jgi:S-adenosylmethionine-dependent methyltransferase
MSQFVRDYYNQNAEREWQRLETPLSRIEFASALWLINKYFPKQGHIADIGGGPGRYAIHLLQLGYRVTLFDLSEALLRVAQAQLNVLGLQAQVVLGDARHLDVLPAEGFDAALLMGPMYHLNEAEDRQQVLQHLRRILRPGGTALITYLNAWGLIRTGLADFPAWYRDIATLRAMVSGQNFAGQSLSGFTECHWSTPEMALAEVELAQLEVVSYAGAQGFGGGMRPVLERLAAENPDAYQNVVQVAAEMCELRQCRDATEHLHIVARKRN